MSSLKTQCTLADSFFLLDPWWNPAVEAQAIDRTHRIGQDKSVIAYRIITRETEEAKILELQKSKRGLADAIITQANSLIQTLNRWSDRAPPSAEGTRLVIDRTSL